MEYRCCLPGPQRADANLQNDITVILLVSTGSVAATTLGRQITDILKLDELHAVLGVSRSETDGGGEGGRSRSGGDIAASLHTYL